MYKKLFILVFGSFSLILILSIVLASTDDFSKKDLIRWEKEFMSVVQTGRELWVSPELGTNGVACAQCHPNAANTPAVPHRLDTGSTRKEPRESATYR